MSALLQIEIYEQPAVLERLIAAESDNISRLTAEIARRNIAYVLVAARGSSDNAARYAQYLFGACNYLPVALATPSLYTLYEAPPRMEGAWVIGISQSGRSPDIVSVIQAGRAQGRPTLAITNAPESPLARAAEWVLPLHAGDERAVAATKTYTASLAALALLSTALAPEAERGPRRAELNRVPELMRQTLAGLEPILPRVERYTFIERSVVVGRGFNYATAFEIALKIKELTRVVTEPYSSADFLHGPISILEAGFPLMVIAPSGKSFSDLAAFTTMVKQRGAELIVISDTAALLQQAPLPLPLPGHIPEWLSPLVAVLPGQMFALRLTQVKGYDADRPIGLTKITETR